MALVEIVSPFGRMKTGVGYDGYMIPGDSCGTIIWLLKHNLGLWTQDSRVKIILRSHIKLIKFEPGLGFEPRSRFEFFS